MLTILPNPGQSLNASRNPIRQNFQDIQTGFTQDHVDWATGDAGKHNRMTMPVQAGDQPTLANEMALYTKNNGAGNPSLYLRYANNGAVVDLTGSIQANTGWMRLPNNMVLLWGSDGIGGNTNNRTQMFNIPNGAGFIRFTNIYSFMVTPAGDGMVNDDPFTAFYYISNDLAPNPQTYTLRLQARAAGAMHANATFNYWILGTGTVI